MGKTLKALYYDQLNVPKERRFLERVDRLCKLIEKETGVPGTPRWAACLTAVEEAIERRKGK